MSKHNYSQYSNYKKNPQVVKKEFETSTEEVEDIVTPPVAAEPQIEETAAIPEGVSEFIPVITPKPAPKPVEGVVVGCVKLNVRTYPSINSDIICVINVNDVVTIDRDKSNKDWFKVRTASGEDGFCMCKFVNVKR